MIFCLFIRLITFFVAFSHDFEHFLFAHAYFIRLIRFLCSACFVNRTTTNKTAKTLILPQGYEADGEVDIKKIQSALETYADKVAFAGLKIKYIQCLGFSLELGHFSVVKLVIVKQ